MWTRIRAKELGLEEVHQGSVDKFPAYEEILRKKGLADAEGAVREFIELILKARGLWGPLVLALKTAALERPRRRDWHRDATQG
jgi:3-deoxy-D-manno-octulosonate 8-phosphate phosphatase KdsC-like HAD superfamily phosphatase